MKKNPFLILLLVPINLGIHFIFDWSYVKGLLVDYLIPTIHFLDILLVLYFIFCLYERKKIKVKMSLPLIFFSIFFFMSLVSVFLSGEKAPAIYSFSRMLLFVPLILFLPSARAVGSVYLLWIPLYFESFLGLIQFIKQKSLFGYLFFGESTFNFYTAGISKTSIFGIQKVAPYGTFPHPNILSFYMGYLLLLLVISGKSEFRKKYFLLFPVPILIILLSGSLHVMLSIFVSLSSYFLLRKAPRLKRILILAICAVLITATFSNRFYEVFGLKGISFKKRQSLNKISLDMIKSSPINGIGLNNFTVRLEDFGNVSDWERFVQPVHNIYLLSASESGIFAGAALFLGVISLLLLTPLPMFVLLLYVFTASFFDHYLLTLPQGQFMFWLTVSLSLPRMKSIYVLKKSVG